MRILLRRFFTWNLEGPNTFVLEGIFKMDQTLLPLTQKLKTLNIFVSIPLRLKPFVVFGTSYLGFQHQHNIDLRNRSICSYCTIRWMAVIWPLSLSLEGLVLGTWCCEWNFFHVVFSSDKLCFSNGGLPRLSPPKTCDLSEIRFLFLKVIFW